MVEGLAHVPQGESVTVFCDSKYVINTMTRGWKRRANTDLWGKLDAEVAKREVVWEWVKGHSGNRLNEEADRAALEEAKKLADGQPSAPRASMPQPAQHQRGEQRTAARPTQAAPRLTHLDDAGEARMVDVGHKPATQRVAVAEGHVVMREETIRLIRANEFDKGDVIGVARVAGIMAAKQVPQLIPLCHAIPIDSVDVEFALDMYKAVVNVKATARTTAKTGVEIEALTAVSVAALTIYDMCKSVDREMRIEGVRLLSKSGGQSGNFFGGVGGAVTPILTFPLRGGRDKLKDTYPLSALRGEGVFGRRAVHEPPLR